MIVLQTKHNAKMKNPNTKNFILFCIVNCLEKGDLRWYFMGVLKFLLNMKTFPCYGHKMYFDFWQLSGPLQIADNRKS